MYVKPPLENLNFGPYPYHSTNTYICGVTIAPRICDGNVIPINWQYNVLILEILQLDFEI